MLEYYLCATDEEGNQILGHKMTEDMMVRWANQITALTWSNMSVVEGQGEGEGEGEGQGQGRMTCWCFRFLSEEAYQSFRAQFVVRMWETMHQTPWEKAKVRVLLCFLSVWRRYEEVAKFRLWLCL